MLNRRLISGTGIGGLIVAAVLWMPWPVLFPILLAVGLLCQFEFLLLTVKTPGRAWLRGVLVAGQGLLLAAFFETGFGGAAGLTPFVLATALTGMLAAGFRRPDDPAALSRVAFGVMSLVYVSLCLGFMARLAWVDWGGGADSAAAWPAMPKSGRVMVLYGIWVIKFGDIGAYAFGMSLGRHKLCPSLSPGKTREGLLGGLLVGLGASCLARWLILRWLPAFPLRIADALALGLLLPGLGVIGDLAESVVKRSLGVKDSGRLVPGMGGILDVLDSLLLATPFLYVYLRVRGL